jgi:hypothetical protein
MLDFPSESLRQLVALGLVAVFVGAVKLADRRYKGSAQSRAVPLGASARDARLRERAMLTRSAWQRRGGELQMRRALIPSVLLASLLMAVARPAMAEPGSSEPREIAGAAILAISMVGPSLRVTVATAGLNDTGADPSSLTVSAWLDGVPIEASLPLVHMPSRFAMDLDLAAGVVRVGGVSVGNFTPVPAFRENLRFPVEVTVRRGALAATARAMATIPLPVVIVPGYLNEWGGPSKELLEAFHRRGYTVSGPGQNVFWFTYPSQQVTLPEGAAALAAYVRGVVLPATYAGRINVVGYSLGGLMARWNVAYDVDGWGSFINRLALVGVPNEGTVMAYLAAHAPSVLPFAGLGRRPATPAFLPTFAFWRADAAEAWTIPPDINNELLEGLNAQPIPDDIRVYVFYGSNDPRHSGGPQTSAGITGVLPGADLTFGDGDGVVLAASAEGLPIRGGTGVPALMRPAVVRVDLGAVYHGGLLDAAADKIARALLDRFVDRVDKAAAPGN